MSVEQPVVDIEHNALLFEVLRLVGAPRTVEQVAAEFDWHPQTARRYLWELRRQGKVKTLARKQGRQQLWQATSGAGIDGSVTLSTREGAVELRSLAGWDDTAVPVGNLIGGALAYAWRRAYYSSLEDSPVHEAKQGSLDPLLEVKSFLSQVHGALARQFDSLSQILLDLPELFEDGKAPLAMMGGVSREEMETAAHEFETFLVARSAPTPESTTSS